MNRMQRTHIPDKFFRSIAVALISATTSIYANAADSIDFGSQIQPILADKCYACHGPDAAQREADLRLDREQDVFAQRCCKK